MKTKILLFLVAFLASDTLATSAVRDSMSPKGRWKIAQDRTNDNQFWIIMVNAGAKAEPVVPDAMKGISQVTYTAAWSKDESAIAVSLFWGAQASGILGHRLAGSCFSQRQTG